jgi:diguanylate cyclase
VDGTEIFRYEIFSRLMLNFAPFVLVAYVTSLLAADLGFARAHVERLADTDELTGLSNMRAFNQALLRQERVARKHEQPLSVLMIDIDNLKIINDGTATKRAMSRSARSPPRSRTRYAPTISSRVTAATSSSHCCPRRRRAAAKRAGERILARIAEQPNRGGADRLGISVSIGLASLPVMAGDVDDLLQIADKALYESKRAGRNRLSVYAEMQDA